MKTYFSKLNLSQSSCKHFFCQLLISWLFIVVVALSAVAQSNTGNPITPNYTPDPDILIANGKYYIYTTAAGDNIFHAYSSSDLTNWVDEGGVFNLNSTTWANEKPYAPNVVFRNNKYYFYFSGNERVGVAVGNSPIGPFTDAVGRPLITDNFNGVNIDQGVFIDDDGQAYLYYGQNTLRVVKLNSDMISTTGSINTSTPSGYFEAPYIFKRNGTYYLTWSVNWYTSDDYHIEYATSSSVFGPWTPKGRLTSPTGFCKGPGHNAVLKLPSCDEWYMIYHGHTGDLNRRTRIDRMYFNSDGSIAPVPVTSTGVTARPVTGSCRLPVIANGGLYRLVNKNSGKVLEVAGGPSATTPGTKVQQASWQGTNNQRWKLEITPDGYYKISVQHSGQALDVDACSKANFGKVQQYTSFNNDCQKWRLEEVGGGYYRIVNKNSDKVLDVNACNVAEGGTVQQYEWLGGDCQRWKLEPVSSSAREGVVAETLLESQLEVFPNPVSKEVTVKFLSNRTGHHSITVSNSQGQLVKSIFDGTVQESVEHQSAWETDALPAGVYIFRLTTPAGVSQRKVIVAH